jgi:hypothetical protein
MRHINSVYYGDHVLSKISTVEQHEVSIIQIQDGGRKALLLKEKFYKLANNKKDVACFIR